MQRTVISGRVEQGKKVGHTLGFPTANVRPFPDQRVPANGVYVGEIRIGEEPLWRRCLINHGLQPTIPSGRAAVEVYILDFEEDIYGAKVDLAFLCYLREERRFDSVDALKEQLKCDAKSAKAYDSVGNSTSV